MVVMVAVATVKVTVLVVLVGSQICIMAADKTLFIMDDLYLGLDLE